MADSPTFKSQKIVIFSKRYVGAINVPVPVPIHEVAEMTGSAGHLEYIQFDLPAVI